MNDKSVAIGLGVGAAVAAAVLLLFGMSEDEGMRMRVNWIIGGLYLFGGKGAVALFLGGSIGTMTWLYHRK